VDKESKMKNIGDIVKDSSGFHKGVGIIISVIRHEYHSGQDSLCIYWPQGDYNTGCRSRHVELVNEDR